MDGSENNLEKILILLHRLADHGFHDVEKQLSTPERAQLPGKLPLYPVSTDTTLAGCERQRMQLIQRRIERLERESYLHSPREKR